MAKAGRKIKRSPLKFKAFDRCVEVYSPPNSQSSQIPTGMCLLKDCLASFRKLGQQISLAHSGIRSLSVLGEPGTELSCANSSAVHQWFIRVLPGPDRSVLAAGSEQYCSRKTYSVNAGLGTIVVKCVVRLRTGTISGNHERLPLRTAPIRAVLINAPNPEPFCGETAKQSINVLISKRLIIFLD